MAYDKGHFGNSIRLLYFLPCAAPKVIFSYRDLLTIIILWLLEFSPRQNMITATTTPAIPVVTRVVVAEPNIHFQKVANNMAPMTRAAV